MSTNLVRQQGNRFYKHLCISCHDNAPPEYIFFEWHDHTRIILTRPEGRGYNNLFFLKRFPCIRHEYAIHRQLKEVNQLFRELFFLNRFPAKFRFLKFPFFFICGWYAGPSPRDGGSGSFSIVSPIRFSMLRNLR
jgi:hypothetical protein